VFSLRAWQYSFTISLQVLFGLPLGLGPSTSYSMHFFTSHYLLFAEHAHTNAACSAVISMLSSIPSLSLSYLLGNLSFSLVPHIHLTILISARWSATTFSFLPGQVSLPCNILLRRCVDVNGLITHKQLMAHRSAGLKHVWRLTAVHKSPSSRYKHTQTPSWIFKIWKFQTNKVNCSWNRK